MSFVWGKSTYKRIVNIEGKMHATFKAFGGIFLNDATSPTEINSPFISVEKSAKLHTAQRTLNRTAFSRAFAPQNSSFCRH